MFTGIVVYEMVAGAVWDLRRIEYVRTVFVHLGYPFYLLTILGVWKFPCAVTLLVPGVRRLKEWAYAGAVFNYTGAAASHAFVGDGPAIWMAPFVFGLFTLASWALRPAERTLPSAPDAETRPGVWIVPIVVIAVMLVIAFVTLPKGASPF
jgi:DoxX-like family